MNWAYAKTELLCLGVKSEVSFKGIRLIGAGPVGGKYFLMPNDSCVDVPIQSLFATKSSLTLISQNGEYKVLKNGEFYMNLKEIPEPAFYRKTTIDGVPMCKIALLHGKDCLASTVYSKCIYWNTKRQCKFCGIELWRHKLDQPIIEKKPEQLSEVAEVAFKEAAAKHMTLTTGSLSTSDKGAILLAEIVRAIKERVNIPVHVQLEPPKNLKFLEHLFHAGVDTVGLHAESFDKKVLAKICPAKTQLDKYFLAWKEAVKLFGEGQVSSFIIAGLGESDPSILHGAEALALRGVFPYLLPLRPIMGTELERKVPPSPTRMIRLYLEVCEILRKYGLDSSTSKAGCVRCGACSALSDFQRLKL